MKVMFEGSKEFKFQNIPKLYANVLLKSKKTVKDYYILKHYACITCVSAYKILILIILKY